MRRFALFMVLWLAAYPVIAQRFVKAFDSLLAMVESNTKDIHTNSFVTGRSSPGDGFQGNFTYVINSTNATNFGTVFMPTNGVGRYIRQYKGKPDVRWFGASGNGTTDDSVAFYRAKLVTDGYYFVPAGTYLIQAGTNIWADPFESGNGVTFSIGGTNYSVNGSIASGWKTDSTTTTYWTWKHARTGATVGIWSDGASSSDSHRFFLPFDWRRDSHAIIMAPASTNGVSDILVRRSEANADAYGNRFTPVYFEEASDRMAALYATTASGAPNFDAAYHIYAGSSTNARFVFPALRPEFQQGWTMQTRTGGVFRLSVAPGDQLHTITSDNNTNQLGGFNRSYTHLAGKNFNTLFDKPGIYEPANTWSAWYSDVVGTNLPVTNTFFTLTGATKYAIIGTMRVAATASANGGYWREARFTYDGTTFTLTDLVNTLPAEITALVTTNTLTNLQFQAAYAGGLGGGAAVSVTLDWNHIGR